MRAHFLWQIHLSQAIFRTYSELDCKERREPSTAKEFSIQTKMNLSFAYNTNGFAHHNLEDALDIISDYGYQGVALTLDNYHCDPFKVDAVGLAKLKQLLEKLRLRVVIETGARYLLDPQHKHSPTLIGSQGRQIRLEFLRRAIDLAHELGAECVSFWSGVSEPGVSEHQSWDWLVTACKKLTEHAKRRAMQLAFEPEPGMLVDDMAKYELLKKHIPSARFGLTLDIGHVFCTETDPFRQIFGKFSNLIRNAHIEDIRDHKHEHLMFGEGELEFESILQVFQAYKYTGLISVELSRDSHRAPEVARRSIEFLKAACKKPAKPAPSATH